jgi:hypothetical protein
VLSKTALVEIEVENIGAHACIPLPWHFFLSSFFLNERPTVALASAGNGELPKIPFESS